MAHPTFLTAASLSLIIALNFVHAITHECAGGRISDGHTCHVEVPQAALAESLLQKKFQREASQFKVQQVVCDGITSVGKCWYLSTVGQNCETTCAEHGLIYSFAAPKHDMVPLLLGRSPSTKYDPWLHVECYQPEGDSYYPYNNDAWGAPGQTAAEELWRGGAYVYESCQLACPCGFEYQQQQQTPAPTPSSPSPTPTYYPGPAVPAGNSCSGLEAYDRCWYLSDRGASCDDTCLSYDCSYAFSAPGEDMVPKLVGHTPSGRDEPWAALECYISKEDRYHPANPTGSSTFELSQAGEYNHESCRMACPCTGQCKPRPPATVFTTTPNPALVQRCSGLVADSACWYLSETGDSCDRTCAARGSHYQFTAPSQDMIPKLIGRAPGTKNSPWLFLECFVPQEDRYHPYNKNAWGVPEKTPPEELGEAGQHTYPTCQLACPCALPLGNPLPPVNPPNTLPPTPAPTPVPPVPTPVPTPVPFFPTPAPTFRPFVVPTPALPPTPAPSPIQGREDQRNWTHVTHQGTNGGFGYVGRSTTKPTPGPIAGFEAVGRMWFMSGLGESCASTCGRQGLLYSWAEPPKDSPITPQLLGKEPGSKQWPWAFLECYVPSEDRYHTANAKAWGAPGMTPQADIGKAADWSLDTCQLACPCTEKVQECGWVQPSACAPEFEYKGKMYTGCPTVDHDEPWCMHHHHHSGKEYYQYEWSTCINTCEEPVPNERCSWKQAPSCVDEFDYEGIHFAGCTNVDHDTPWCSNTDPYTGSWAHCVYDCENPTAEDQQRIDQIKEGVMKDDLLCSWKPVQECEAMFTYKGFDYEGCALFVDYPTPWCSHDRVHNGKWSQCEQFCTKVTPGL